jgi:hypothetical protein
MQLYHYFVSQSSEFCHHNTLLCFSTSVYCCLFRYRFSPETFGYTIVQRLTVEARAPSHCCGFRNIGCHIRTKEIKSSASTEQGSVWVSNVVRSIFKHISWGRNIFEMWGFQSGGDSSSLGFYAVSETTRASKKLVSWHVATRCHNP